MSSLETAHRYDLWASLWCIACACGRKTWVDRPRAPVYLNMYLILIGDSGIPRKTTSVSVATSMVRAMHPEIIDTKLTAEGLDVLLSKRTIETGLAEAVIAVPELAVLLGGEGYMRNMPTTLTDLYDCPTIRQGGTVSRGLHTQRDVWVSLLSASTPIWLLRTVNPTVIEGGFASRCYFVVANEPKQNIPWPRPRDESASLTNLAASLQAIHAWKGPLALSYAALEEFSDWYTTRTHSLDPFRQSFEAREDAHALRIAALLCLNEGNDTIASKHIRLAIELINSVKLDSGAMFENGIMRTKYASAFDVVRKNLVEAGDNPTQRYVLARKCKHWLQRDEFAMLMEVMHEVGAVQRYKSYGERGRPAEFFCAMPKLLAHGTADLILERFS